MAIYEDLVQEVLNNLEGFTGDQDVYGTVASLFDEEATTFSVLGYEFPDGFGFTAGLIEVGDELVYAQNFDREEGEFSGVLRGWRGTTRQGHGPGEVIRNNPRYPRIAIKRAINDTIAGLYPMVPAIKTHEFNYSGAQVRYDIPADCRAVVQVSYNTPGPDKVWIPSRRWNFDATGGSTSTTSKAIEVFDGYPGRKVQVVYYAEPSPLVSDEQPYTTTGLPEWTRELVVLGACYRLAAFTDASRIGQNSAAQVLLNQQQPAANMYGTNMSKYFLGLYEQRLAEAATRIQSLYPAVRHYI